MVQDDGGTANGGVDTSPPQTFTITVSDDDDGGGGDKGTNRPPIANSDSATTDVNTSVRIDVLGNDSDPDGDAIAIAAVGVSEAAIVDGAIVFAPLENFVGETTFGYTVCDSGTPTRCAVGAVTVSVVAPPETLIDLEVSVASSQALVGVRQAFAVTVLVTNTGPATATGITLAVFPPTSFTAAEDLVWRPSDLVSGSSDSAVFLMQANVAGNFEISAEAVSVDQPDSDSLPGDGEGDDFAVAGVRVDSADGGVLGGDIAGLVFVDENGDGVRGPGEGPPPGVTELALQVEYGLPFVTTVAAGEASFANLLMPSVQPGVGTAGTLHGAGGHGSPIALAARTQTCPISFVKSGQLAPFKSRFDEDGAFRVSCGSGRYTIEFPVFEARELGYRVVNYTLPIVTEIEIGGTWRREFALVRIQDDPLTEYPQSLSGTVWTQDSAGDLSETVGVPITLQSKLDPAFELLTQTDLEGGYRFEVPPGRYEVEITVPPGLLLVEPRQGGFTVEVDAEENITRVDFILAGALPPAERSGIIGVVWLDKNRNGVVDDAAGGGSGEQRIDGATVTLSRGGAIVGTQTSGLDGGFEFLDLEPGTYEVSVGLEGPVANFSPVTSATVTVAVDPGDQQSAFIPFGFASAQDFQDKHNDDGLPLWPLLLLLLLLVPLILWMRPK
ncbi:MAG: Ig-like domain-containing protein, partial [Acidimicrobiia bacterium]|nr:Ig-like domain-containing protein [Acidimicrobiia bacterium]